MKLPSFNFAPAEGEEPPGILKVPGHFFFCEYVEVPAELEADDLDDFAEMSLGGLSPFPPEQLAWGF